MSKRQFPFILAWTLPRPTMGFVLRRTVAVLLQQVGCFPYNGNRDAGNFLKN